MALSWRPGTDFASAWRRLEIRTWIPAQRGAELASGRGFHFSVAPNWHPGANSTSPWRRAGNRTQISFRCCADLESRRANIQTRIPLRRGAELKCGRGFHFGVAPSWHTDADSTSAWRRAEIRRGFHFAVPLSWNPDENSTSAWRRAGIRTRISLRRGAELANERRFPFGAAPCWHPNVNSKSAWRRAGI